MCKGCHRSERRSSREGGPQMRSAGFLFECRGLGQSPRINPNTEFSQNGENSRPRKERTENCRCHSQRSWQLHGFGQGRGRKPSGPSQVRAPEGDHTPVRFIIDGERRLVIARFGESLMATDIHNYAKALSAHPDFDPSFSEIAISATSKSFRSRAPIFCGSPIRSILSRSSQSVLLWRKHPRKDMRCGCTRFCAIKEISRFSKPCQRLSIGLTVAPSLTLPRPDVGGPF